MCLGWSALVHGQSHGLPTKASFHGVERWGVVSPLNLRQQWTWEPTSLEQDALRFQGERLTSPITVLLTHCSSRHRCRRAQPCITLPCSESSAPSARTRAEPRFHVGVWSSDSLPEISSALSYGTGRLEKVEGYLRAYTRKIKVLTLSGWEHRRTIFSTSQGHSWKIFWTFKTLGLTLTRLHTSCWVKFA